MKGNDLSIRESIIRRLLASDQLDCYMSRKQSVKIGKTYTSLRTDPEIAKTGYCIQEGCVNIAHGEEILRILLL